MKIELRFLVAGAACALMTAACGSGGNTTTGTGTAGTSGAAGTTGTAGTGSAGTTGAAGTTGGSGSSGAAGTTGAAGTGGAGKGGSGGTTDGGAGTTGTAGSGTDGGTDVPVPTAHFSFFATSLKALQDLSKSPQGFGGDLRYGETGMGAGLRGADKICAAIAERSMKGAGGKPWRAFLSAVAGEDGKQVNAIDRIGAGPWYDRLGRTFALTKADLLFDRPKGDAAVVNDFPNEDGVGNHAPDPTVGQVDNHDFLTGTNPQGQLYSATATCASWTGGTGTEGKPRVGHTWARGAGGGAGSGANWMSSLDESGCAPGVNTVEMGGPLKSSNTVGSGGGYGGFYCFSLTP